MSKAGPAQEKLQQAIESLRDNIDRVEFWADAIEGWTQPIPEYCATDDLSRHLLPTGSAPDSAVIKKP